MNPNSRENEFADLRKRANLSMRMLADKVGFSERTLYRWERGEAKPRKAVLQLLSALAGAGYASREPAFRFIDLFAGIGGMRRGFEALGGMCVFTSEWNSYAQKTYMANFDCSHEIVGDITKVDSATIPEHDVLLAGFPCQPFSIAGVSKKNALNMPHGFMCETQGTLFFDVARIIAVHRPKAFVLENVKNLARHDGGRTMQVILRMLVEELGYQVTWKVLNAEAWVPQRRERIFIVGFREPNAFSFEDFALPGERVTLRSILHPEDGSELAEAHYTEGERAMIAPKYTLSDHLWSYLRSYAQRHRAAGNGFGYGLFGPDDISRTLSARYYKDGSEILIRQENGNPRRLTPRECARLMGFDNGSGRSFAIPVSDTQAYKQFGNSVVVPCVEAIARHMAPWIYTSEPFASAVRAQPLPLHA